VERKIYGRQATDVGVTLGEIFESDPNLFDQYMRSIEAVDPGIVPGINYKGLAKRTLDRLENEDILIYLADSLQGHGASGLYKRGSYDSPDTAFVAKYDFGRQLPAREVVNTSLHEALLHGAGMQHKSRVNPFFGRMGSALLDYLFPGKIIPTEEQVEKSGQWAYRFEEADLEDAMRQRQAYLPYAELLLGRDRYLEEVEKDRRSRVLEDLKPLFPMEGR
tara:strand:+ start:109 stop:768 length:660 start_codon:yes stop_codon:yes gene_type:complete